MPFLSMLALLLELTLSLRTHYHHHRHYPEEFDVEYRHADTKYVPHHCRYHMPISREDAPAEPKFSSVVYKMRPKVDEASEFKDSKVDGENGHGSVGLEGGWSQSSGASVRGTVSATWGKHDQASIQGYGGWSQQGGGQVGGQFVYRF